MKMWYVYVLVSKHQNRTYVGISTDTQRRLRQHNGFIKGGAKSTRVGRPWEIARILGPFEKRGPAQSKEYEIKKRRGKKRLMD